MKTTLKYKWLMSLNIDVICQKMEHQPIQKEPFFFFLKFRIFFYLILNCLLSWMFKKLFILFYYHLLMQHIPCHRTCLELHSFALPDISCCDSNIEEWRTLSGSAIRSPGQLLIWAAKSLKKFPVLIKTMKMLDHYIWWPVAHQNAMNYILPLKSLVNQPYFRKKTSISLIQWEELQ